MTGVFSPFSLSFNLSQLFKTKLIKKNKKLFTLIKLVDI